ncbi:MAG: hypothetical protein J0L60_07450 [Ignavibacteria bacterium]|nr:hypothetical protein [Ignavibacteria bacterium]MCA0388735.1 hypothetical protein [Bacteroidota bacterium]
MFSQVIRYFEMFMALFYIGAGVVVYLGYIPLFENLSDYELYLISGGLVVYGTFRIYRSYKRIMESREENSNEEDQ